MLIKYYLSNYFGEIESRNVLNDNSLLAEMLWMTNNMVAHENLYNQT